MPLFISRTAELMLKSLRGELTDEQEQKELNQVITESEEIQLLSNQLSDEAYLRAQVAVMAGLDPAPGLKKLKAAGLIKSRKRPLWKYVAAAAIILIIAGGIYYFNNNSSLPQTIEITKTIPQTLPSRKPDSMHSRGYLELADKSKIGLDMVADGIIAFQDGSKVEINGKHVRYGAMSTEVGIKFSTIREERNTIGIKYNTLVVDSGGDFQLTLSDSTKVWLNAGSSIRYPVHFTGTERHVEISGEAYFEVAEYPSMPFRVTARNVETEALGTDFNIMAHPGESIIATLVTGSAKVSAAGKSKTLSPGQQIAVSGKGIPGKVVKPNIEQVIAWKNEKFDFRDKELPFILLELGRWYNLEVDLSKVPNVKRAGVYPRSIPIKEVLVHLSAPADVQIKLEGNKIVVY